ncbi:MAG: ABC transporter permease [Caldilineaceae bacterium]|nr:molybdate ABC transporter permease subunit [Caldilineaceae bacterium]
MSELRTDLPRRRESAAMRVTVGVAGALMLTLLLIPLVALLWRGLEDPQQPLALLNSTVLDAVRLSLVTTGVSMICVILLGTPLAYAFARYRFPFKRALNLIVELPIVLPPVVAGLALLMAFGRRGLFGPALATLDISLPFTPVAIVIAQVFVASPFYVRAAQVRFEAIPREIEEAAGMDGASGWQIFGRITLPLSSRALLTGLMLSWARALGEFGATILFAGNLPGRTQTMPLLVYSALERDLNAALWTGLLLVVLAVTTLGLVNWVARRLADQEESDPLADRF